MPDKLLYIFCEGHTEEAVLKHFLRDYWSQRFVDCEVIRYDGAGDLKVNFAVDATREFKGEPEASVLCLVDLYEEPFGVYDKSNMSREEGFDAVRKQLTGQIKPEYHHRFGAFPVVMELETWLLADPQIQSHINTLYPAPETIEHPAQELKNWKSNYNKRIHGKDLFNRVNARRVYEDNCPHFKLLIDWIITEPEKPDPQVLKSLHQWEAHQQALITRRDEAQRKSQQALEQGALEEAIQWDEQVRQLEREIQDHATSYAQNFE